ncbi:MAG TPA: glycosyl hydrolase family 28 protein [Polyangiaceae bacterium]|nr:glycosyl hydrolase family 28 protein [Polyangiaceae bacterium]
MRSPLLLACLFAVALVACASDDSAGSGSGGKGATTAGTGATAGSAAGNGGSTNAGAGNGGSSGSASSGASNGGNGAGSGGVGGSGAAAGASLGGAGGSAGGGAGASPLGGAAGLDVGGSAGVPGGAAGTATAGAAGACTGADCGTPMVVTYPTPPGAVASTLYTVKVNGVSLYVEKLTKYAPEMQIHYAHASLSALPSAKVEVTVGESFNSYTVSPKSRNLAATKSDRTITFSTGPNYLILTFDTKELLFILLDDAEVNPPKLGDPNVKSIADYDVDATGATLQTSKIQSAIDAASGAAQNILYFPPGKYLIGELWLKSDMTLYLAGGALLYGSGSTSDFTGGANMGIDIEGCSHGVIRMFKIQNAKILGRGVIDGNGKAIRAQNDTKINMFKIEQSSGILIDGILVRDPSFWNTLVYRSDMVTIQNYKMLNCRPTTTTYNNTDGVNFDESTNGRLYNALLYTGDDSMATKNEEPSGTVNTKNIVHEHVVAYSNSVGCKIGTKTMGQSIDGVVFKDIDVVKAGRALNIDAYDTAVVQNTRYENIRVEAADSLFITLDESMPPDWRDAANQSIIKDTYFYDITSYGPKTINLQGKSTQYGITGVHFKNVVINGQPVTSQSDADATWTVNSAVSGITFDQ